jgi:Na+-transporting NADH:ubiquinone oxidoreductase subunit NqrF
MGTKYKNDSYYYVSGNPGYVTAVTTILQSVGVDPKQIKFDKFTGY